MSNQKLIFFISPDEKRLWATAGDRAPLGIGYLSSYCKEILGTKTRIFDLNHDSEEDLKKNIISENPDLICMTVTAPNYLECLRLAKILRGISPAKIVAGGNHITDNPYEENTVKNYDYLIVGDGETALKQIIEGKADKQVIISEKVDVNSVPWPDYYGLKFERYSLTLEGKKCAMIITSRGCIYSCAFCSSAKIKKWRPRNPEDVIQEMRFLMDTYGIESFYFGDDLFSFDKKRTLEICKLIKERLNSVSFRIMTRVNLLDNEVLSELKSAGCEVINLGLESGNDQILKNIQKGATVEHARDAVKRIHEHGMKVKGFFIFGLPGETWETAMDTIKFAKEILVDFVDFYPYTPFPSTPIWNNPERYGLEIIKPVNSDWNQYFMLAKDGMPSEWKIKHPNLTQEQIKQLINLAKIEVQRAGMPK